MKTNDINRKLIQLESKLNQKLQETGGEITEDAESILDEIQNLEIKAEEKAQRIIDLAHAMNATKEGMKGTYDYYKNLADDYKKSMSSIDKQIGFLQSLVKSLVDKMPEKSMRKRDGKKVWIQEYESTDSSEITDEEKAVLTEYGIGQKVVTHKVLKSDLDDALSDMEHHPDNIKHILNKVRKVKSESLRGM